MLNKPSAPYLSLIAGLVTLPAFAQTASVDSPPTDATPLDVLPTISVATEALTTVPATRTGATQRSIIDEVIVTAQKRKQRIQDVPAAVSVVSQKQLEAQNITQVTDLGRAVPSVELNGGAGDYNSKMGIRGLSTESYSRTSEQAVSIVVDGVVMGKTSTNTLFDINRIEVLRGPQGTLFGKNASAGVISITTNAPDPSQFAVGGHVDLGSRYGYRIEQMAVNVPLTDTMALRVNAGQTYSSGFLHNNISGKDSIQDLRGVRGRYLWNISDDLTFNLYADYERQHITDMTFLVFDQYGDSNGGEAQPIPGCGGVYADHDNRVACNGSPTFSDHDAYGYSAQLEWRVADYVMTSISALRQYNEHSAADVDGLPGDFFRNGNVYNNRVITEEFRIASPVDRDLQYVAGLFFYDARVPNRLTQIIGADGALGVVEGPLGLSLCSDYGLCGNDIVGINQPNYFTAKMRSTAAFGEINYRLLDPLHVILGARYTHDDIKMVSTSLGGVLSGSDALQRVIDQIPLITLSPPLSDNTSVNKLSWRTGLQYEFSRDAMGYMTVSNGYKGPQVIFVPPVLAPTIASGAIYPPHGPYTYVVRPEYPRAYEIGLKSTFLDGALAVDINYFYTKVRDYQSSQFNNSGEFLPVNISSVVSQGVELDLFGKLATGLSVNAGFLYNSVTYPPHYLYPCTQVGPGCAGTSAYDFENIGGRQLPVAPVLKLTLAPEYEFELPWRIHGFISGDMVYRSSMRYMPNDDTRTAVGDRTILGARLGLRWHGGAWELSAFGRNLTNAYNPEYVIAPFTAHQLSAPSKDTAGHVLSPESFRLLGLSLTMLF